jgi:hypothetical protein
VTHKRFQGTPKLEICDLYVAEPTILLDLKVDVNENCERRIEPVWGGGLQEIKRST